jgi:hypothetical protein
MEGLAMECVVKFYDQQSILWPFGIFYVFWYIFHRFGLLCREKSGNPGLN